MKYRKENEIEKRRESNGTKESYKEENIRRRWKQ
jgi:hypothetical protein